MLKLHQLARQIAPALQSIDLSVYLPRKRRRPPTLELSQLVAAVIWFGSTGMRCFKRYVELILPMHFIGNNLSYSRWGAWRRELSPLIEALAQLLCAKAGYIGTALVDSTPLAVCSIQRERDNKSFARTASKAKSSLGWFFGFKLHLLASDKGALLRAWFTPANVHDVKALDQPGFLDGLKGRLIADNAYRGAARTAALVDKGIGLFVHPRKAESKNLETSLRVLFTKRWRIETLIGNLKEHCGLRQLCSCRCLAALKTQVFSALLLYTLNFETRRP